MLYLALICLQVRPIKSAAKELIELGIKGLQLTPGLVPNPDFKPWLERENINYLIHHGFS